MSVENNTANTNQKKTHYMKMMRDTLGDMLNSKILSESELVLRGKTIASITENEKAKHWIYHIVEVSEDRCLGILIRTRRIQKFRYLLDKWGVMVIKEIKLKKVGRETQQNHDLSAYVFSLRIPEEQDIEKYLEKQK